MSIHWTDTVCKASGWMVRWGWFWEEGTDNQEGILCVSQISVETSYHTFFILIISASLKCGPAKKISLFHSSLDGWPEEMGPASSIFFCLNEETFPDFFQKIKIMHDVLINSLHPPSVLLWGTTLQNTLPQFWQKRTFVLQTSFHSASISQSELRTPTINIFSDLTN